jgi:DNA-binding response OmpR family regulator
LPAALVVSPRPLVPAERDDLARGPATVDVVPSVSLAVERGLERAYDLLVLANMPVDQLQEAAQPFLRHRRWRLLPILYVLDPAAPGLAIPGSYRPELDGLVKGAIGSRDVQRRIVALARRGRPAAELIVAGPVELDPARARLRLAGVDVALTGREAEILGLLLMNGNRTVPADEIIARGWGVETDGRHLQILRRHVSNIRGKLAATPARRSLRTVRGVGYSFDAKLAG